MAKAPFTPVNNAGNKAKKNRLAYSETIFLNYDKI